MNWTFVYYVSYCTGVSAVSGHYDYRTIGDFHNFDDAKVLLKSLQKHGKKAQINIFYKKGD